MLIECMSFIFLFLYSVCVCVANGVCVCFRVRRSDGLSVNGGPACGKLSFMSTAIYEADVRTLVIGAVTNPGVAVGVLYLELWRVAFLC